jgi:hypothetical protein
MSKQVKLEGQRYLDYQEGMTAWSDQARKVNEGVDLLTEQFTNSMPVVFRLYCLKHYLGVLLTAVEVLGLNPKQEKSFKDVIKMNFWDFVQKGFVVPLEVDEELTPRIEELVGNVEGIMTEDEARAAGIDVDGIQKEFDEGGSELLNI